MPQLDLFLSVLQITLDIIPVKDIAFMKRMKEGLCLMKR